MNSETEKALSIREIYNVQDAQREARSRWRDGNNAGEGYETAINHGFPVVLEYPEEGLTVIDIGNGREIAIYGDGSDTGWAVDITV